MSGERQQKIEALFQEALDLPGEQRTGFLDERCGTDPTLRREVESLLAAYDRAGSLLDEPAAGPGTDLSVERRRSSAAPERVGPYRLVRQIGEGGMSEVFLAVRDDDEYRKRVAVKIIRHDLDREDMLRRFRTERQILAGLDHPNIATLLDGGTTDDGLPYFVMEFIDGEPIDRYCDDQRLTLRERLELFGVVCSAVQYAHQNLVVHRDIKASNILVTADGVPKLLDFGIAKLLNPEQFAQRVEYTATWMRPMTPRYASPEQVQGKLVGTPSDVYSLGVLLYKLLAGRMPYRLEGGPPDELASAIQEQVPDRPSSAVFRDEPAQATDPAAEKAPSPEELGRARRAQPQQLSRQLSGDLDNIVLMALRKEPQRRYSSVERFSEDIRRYVDGLPVLARTDTLGYRTAKFLRRNRLAVTVGVAFVVLLIGFLITMIFQRNQARLERDRAEQVVAFMEEIFEYSDPYGASGEEVTAREILDRGAERIDRELRDQPESQATLAEAIGTVYTNLGLYDRARPLLERSLALRRQVLRANHPDLVRSLNSLGELHNHSGNFDAARPLLEEALEKRRRGGAKDALLAETLDQLAEAVSGAGDLETAERLYREAVEIRRGLGETPELAAQEDNLAELLVERGDIEGARQLFRDSLELRRKLLGPDHPLVGESLNNLGATNGMLGDYEESERLLREALDVRRRALGDEHPMVGHTVNNLGRLLHMTGRLDEAELLYREALALERRRLGNDHPKLAIMINNVAELLQGREDYPAAEGMAREALEIRRNAFDPPHTDLGKSLIRVGEILVVSGRTRQAEPLLRESLGNFEGALPAGHWRIAEARSVLGDCLAADGRFDEAEPLLVEGYRGIRDERGPDHRRTLQALQRVIRFYETSGNLDAATEFRALLPD